MDSQKVMIPKLDDDDEYFTLSPNPSNPQMNKSKSASDFVGIQSSQFPPK